MNMKCFFVNDGYSYDELKNSARSATAGTLLKEYIGSVCHYISETKSYETQFYIANITDREYLDKDENLVVYITDLDSEFKIIYKENIKFDKNASMSCLK